LDGASGVCAPGAAVGYALGVEAVMATWQVFQADAGDFGVLKDGQVWRRGLKAERGALLLIRQHRAAGERIIAGVASLAITGPEVAPEADKAPHAAEPTPEAPVVEVSVVVVAEFDVAGFLSDVAADVIKAIEAGEVDDYLADIEAAESAKGKRKTVLAAIKARLAKVGA